MTWLPNWTNDHGFPFFSKLLKHEGEIYFTPAVGALKLESVEEGKGKREKG